jgi:hypothetical protein
MMKQKAGLGKKVSSIFDGVPLPNIVREAPQAPGYAPPPVMPSYRPDAAVAPRPMQTMPLPPKPAPVAVPQPPRMMPSQPPRMPARSVAVAASANTVSGAAWQQLIYKMFFSGDSETDARNKKAAVMMGMLSVVLVVVVMWTGVFSGPPSKPAAGIIASATAGNGVRIAWTPPEPYPANFRDPMQVGSVSSTNGGGSVEGFGGFIVKSIVFSADNPTAVINGQIVKVGQTVNGAAVTKINKDSVEFFANGKSWKQQVE